MANQLRGALLATLILACATGALFPGAALAGTLDQQQTNAGGGAYGAYSAQSLAQTFTAGASGGLDQVDLYLLQSGTPAAPLSVEIRDVSGTAPGNTVLAGQSVPASSITPNPGAFLRIDFAAPAPVAAGTRYAIVAYSSTVANPYYWAFSSTASPYEGGRGLSTTTFPPSGGWSSLYAPVNDLDFAFKTYVVVPTVAPPTVAPTVVPIPGPTGQRAVALQKCKTKFQKNHNKKKFKKCKKKAKLLPA